MLRVDITYVLLAVRFLAVLVARPSREEPDGLPVRPRAPVWQFERLITLAQRDSQEILRQAKLAQQRFERLRRQQLAKLSTRDIGCHERIGWYCLYFPRAWVSLGEAPVVRQAREELIDTLAAAAHSLPGDEWILGQRVRYLVEVARPAEALALARNCRIARSWSCTALAGYAWHVMEDFRCADSAFADALRAMPEEERRDWTDISVFLDGEARDIYLASSDQQRDSLERRFWWLADPLYTTPGNDRRTEQFARNVLARLYGDGAAEFFTTESPDVQQIILRHGLPAGWIKTQYPVTSRILVYAPHSRRFVPHPHFLLDPAAIQPREWIRPSSAPSATYAPTYVSSFTPLEHQVAVFQRGDSAVIVGAYDQSVDWTWLDELVEAALILRPDELSAPVVRSKRQRGPRGVLIVTVEAKPKLLSFELRSLIVGRAARVRYGLRLGARDPLRLAASSLLVLSRPDTLPTSLLRAVSHARGSLRARPAERLGLYWEVYGLGPQTEALWVSVAMYKIGEGEPGQLEDIEFEDEPQINVEWQEIVPARTHISSRATALELPPDLLPGLYVLYLTVSTFGREPLHQARALYVEP
jgi:hypothetical protein